MRTTTLFEAEYFSALRLISAQCLLVLADACQSGGVESFKGLGAGVPTVLDYSEKSLDYLAKGTGRILVASSRLSEETCLPPNARNSVLTSCPFDALPGNARANGNDVIRVCEIFSQVAEMVKR